MIIASNFKTNYTRGATKAFIKEIQAFVANTTSKQQVRIFAPFTALDCFDEVAHLKVGAQNFYPVQNGSFTGEIGFEQLEEFGIDTVLIGHSERRHILKESQNFIAQKYDFAKAREVEIIYCIGEPQEIRMQGIDAIMSYLWEQFEGIDIHYDKLIIAYEPVWAIGTGLTASLEDIEEVLTRLRDKLSAPLLYGGSVKVENIDAILHVKACDGVLVGTASWNEKAFCEMIRIADTVKK
ncbi:MAG: Triosephosphate isomerase [Proteobacteria bacterium]|nr:Triosephosphate isomerase [Pseudomonadota bacterium]